MSLNVEIIFWKKKKKRFGIFLEKTCTNRVYKSRSVFFDSAYSWCFSHEDS